jgi:hypothetical protein
MKIKITRQFAVLAFLATLFVTTAVSAHGFGVTQTREVGPYTIEFEYNSLTNIQAQEYTLFLVYLLDTETKAGQDYDSATVRIEKQDGPGVLSGNLKGSSEGLGFSSISGTIPEEGLYLARVAFYRDGKSLASADFSFQVDPKENTNKSWVYPLLGAVLFLLGGGVGYVFKKSKK